MPALLAQVWSVKRGDKTEGSYSLWVGAFRFLLSSSNDTAARLLEDTHNYDPSWRNKQQGQCQLVIAVYVSMSIFASCLDNRCATWVLAG